MLSKCVEDFACIKWNVNKQKFIIEQGGMRKTLSHCFIWFCQDYFKKL